MPRYQPILDEAALKVRTEAIAASHTRMLAIAWYADPACISWMSFLDEQAMQKYIDGWEESESMAANCAQEVAVVIPNDTEETIRGIIAARHKRSATNPNGYFASAL